jgi:hypothetical protein
MYRSIILGIAFFAVWTIPAQSAESNSCDAVLVQQSSNLKENNDAFLSWLQIVDQENYSKAKTTASASGITSYGMFDGDYSNFKEQRSKYFSHSHYVQTVSNARESFKAYLSPEQVAAWVACKHGAQELVVYYKDVDQQGATLVLEWNPGPAVGELTSIHSSFPLGVSADLSTLHSLNGIREFPIRRSPTGAAIRGTIAGKAGANKSDYSGSVYIPKFDDSDGGTGPDRLLVSQANVVRESIAYWAKGRFSASWTCIRVPEGYDLVVAEEKRRDLGIHRGACVPGPPFCDSLHEGCSDMVIVKGCLVSTRWHNWYKATALKSGVPYSKYAVCE